jgi:hypothetical protein
MCATLHCGSVPRDQSLMWFKRPDYHVVHGRFLTLGKSTGSVVSADPLTVCDDHSAREAPEKRVTSAEFVFDLVFVFAITQVSSLLEGNRRHGSSAGTRGVDVRSCAGCHLGARGDTRPCGADGSPVEAAQRTLRRRPFGRTIRCIRSDRSW